MLHKNIKWKNSDDELFEELSQEKYKSKYVTRQDSEAQSKRAKATFEDPKNEEAKQKVLDALERGRENGASSKGGATRGQQIKEDTEWFQELCRMRTEASLERITCEVCGTDANIGNYARFHGKKCKHNAIMAFYDELPTEFTRQIALQVLKEGGHEQNFWRKINQGYMDLIECIHEGTNGSSKDVPIYRKVVK